MTVYIHKNSPWRNPSWWKYWLSEYANVFRDLYTHCQIALCKGHSNLNPQQYAVTLAFLTESAQGPQPRL